VWAGGTHDAPLQPARSARRPLHCLAPPPPRQSQPGTSDAELSKLLLLSGFAGAAPAPGGGLAASKPAWDTGARAAIALKPRNGSAAAPAGKAAATWTLGGDEDEDEELVDDEALLIAEDTLRPAAPGG
jgi:hypothetical protein